MIMYLGKNIPYVLYSNKNSSLLKFIHYTQNQRMFQKYLESLAVATHLCIVICMPVIGPFFLLFLLYIGSYSRYFAILYLLIIYLDWDTKDNGGHNWQWFTKSKYMKLIQSYFQMSLEAEVEIPPNKNYIVGLHPHGVLVLGILANFNQDDKNYKKIFNNGKISLCTAHYNLELPIQREYFYLLHSINASEKGILSWLSNKDVSHYTMLCIGGSEEAMLTTPDVHQVILKKRKGFCRLAIKSGANLLPTYIFGENSLWDTVKIEPGSFLHKMQLFVHNYFNIGLPIMKGTWKYQYFFVMPKRNPLTVVFGEPVEVEQCDEPSKQQIDDLHQRYCKALTTLFDNNKVKYLGDKNAQLIIL